MNYINRAYKNITRKFSKSILLGLTFFLIGNFVIVGLGVSSAADSAKIMARKNMRAVVEYKVDHEKFWEDAEEIEDDEEKEEFYKNQPTISIEEVSKFMGDSRVKVANAITSERVHPIGFEHVLIGNEREENDSNNIMVGSRMDFGGIDGGDQEYIPYVEPAINLKGNLFPNMIEFEDGLYELIEGSMYTQEHIDNNDKVCLITDTLAELNNLSVGDTISVNTRQAADFQHNPDRDYNLEDGIIEMEIIGIFDNKEEIDPSSDNFDWMGASESPENIILTPSNHVLEKRFEFYVADHEYYKNLNPEDEYYSDPDNAPTMEDINRLGSVVLLLNDPLEVDGFVEEFTKTSENEYLILDANNETFLKLAKPLDTLSLFANIIIWLVIINAIVIITLVTALTLKTREYEIGVLLSLGVSKTKVVAQFFVELAIIAVIGFTLAVMSGSMIASSVGNAVLDFQVATSDVEVEDDNNYYYGETDYFTEVSLEDITKNYEVTISPWIIAQIYVAGLGMVLISILIPSLMIMRFNPKKILLNTN